MYFDFKLGNVFVIFEDYCKLVDFGCCCVVEENNKLVSLIKLNLIGIYVYRVLEFLKGESFIMKVDIYFYGICLW